MAKQPKPKSSLLAKLPEKSRFVSRGGEKLRGALDTLGIQIEGKICLDVGSSTGGFTDCLLQSGAKSVFAVDVGWGLLDYKLRKDPRVIVLERTNFRFFDLNSLPERPSLVTADVSFISLDKILSKIWDVLVPSGEALILVKPQFESTPKEAPGGIVKDERVRERVLNKIKHLSKSIGFKVKSHIDSTLQGRKGNKEIFLLLEKPNF